MAERRMFAKTIIDSDAFLDMPMSAQLLYFHLSMRADDDGFVNSPKRIQRTIGASDDDMRILIGKAFIIPFDNGIVVIKHWRINNYIRNDRYTETVYSDEKAQLVLKPDGGYTLKTDVGIPNDNHAVYQRDTQYRLGEVRLGKDRERECAPVPALPREETHGFAGFKPPTLDEVKTFVNGSGLDKVDAETFFNYYTATNWRKGKTQIVFWENEARLWQRREVEREKEGVAVPRHRGGGEKNSSKNFGERNYTEAELKKVMTTIDDLDENDL